MILQFSIGEDVDVIGDSGNFQPGKIVGYTQSKEGWRFHVRTAGDGCPVVPPHFIRFRNITLREQLD